MTEGNGRSAERAGQVHSSRLTTSHEQSAMHLSLLLLSLFATTLNAQANPADAPWEPGTTTAEPNMK